MKAQDALKHGEEILKHTPSSKFDALQLLSVASGKSTSALLANYNISSEVYSKFLTLINRRATREPLDSIIGFTIFNGVKVMFNANTLTPRKETELLADIIIKEINKQDDKLSVLDLCCGSGCIGISIAKHTNATVTCADICDHALKHTKQTAEINGVQVNIKKSNMLKNIKDKYNIIVCNPPYIDSNDMKNLEEEVANYDPHLALHGGEDGMYFYKELAQNAINSLTDNSKLYLELDSKNAYKIKQLFSNFNQANILKDYYNKNRFLVVSKN